MVATIVMVVFSMGNGKVVVGRVLVEMTDHTITLTSTNHTNTDYHYYHSSPTCYHGGAPGGGDNRCTILYTLLSYK
jgi:hypothetical protein